MKFHILSDLHIDSYQRQAKALGHIPTTDADVILVAGDTANGDSGMAWLTQQSERLQKPLITIAGNHEYFNQDVCTFDRQLARWHTWPEVIVTSTLTHSLPAPSLSVNDYGASMAVLQCSHVDIENIRILGCTLWTDYQYGATEQTLIDTAAFMRDYRCIDAGDKRFSPQKSVDIHHQQRQWLQSALQQAHQLGKTVVVMTHHSVSPLSVSPRFANFASNAAFVTDLSAWMHQVWAPKLWVHGHTHEAFDYHLGNTHVVVNPRAYPGEISSTDQVFAWDKVVSV